MRRLHTAGSWWTEPFNRCMHHVCRPFWRVIWAETVTSCPPSKVIFAIFEDHWTFDRDLHWYLYSASGSHSGGVNDSFRETGIFKTQCIAACSEAGGVLCSAGRSRCGNCLCSCLTFDEHDSSAAVRKRGKLMSNATSAVRWWCCIHVLYKHFTVLHIYIIYTYTFYIIPRFYIFGLRLRMFCLPLVHKLRMPQTRRFIGYGLWIAVRSWEEKF